MCHNLKDILARGYIETGITPSTIMPGYSFMAKHKQHGAFRLSDGRWHYFRFADSAKAAERDAEYEQSMMPKNA